MRSKKLLLRNWKVYIILDSGLFPDTRKLSEKFSDLLESGADAIQLRFKSMSDPRFYETALGMVTRAKRKGIPVIINDRPDIALALGADGVHLGKGDLPPSVAREMLGDEAVIGRTIRSEDDLASIDTGVVDYVAIGPVFRTPLKPHLRTVRPAVLQRVASFTDMHPVAVGGINRANVRKVASAGINTVAVARYGTSGNVRTKVKGLKKALR